MPKGSIPVLVGVGQTVSHWTPEDGVETAPSFLSLAVDAATKALADTGARDAGSAQILAKQIDTVAIVRTMADSVPSFPQVFGRCDNLPRGVSAGIGANPAEAIYAAVGGQSPQSLVNEMAARIHAGSSEVALIGGTEALGALKSAKRAGLELNFATHFEGALEDRGLGPTMLSRSEIKHGMVVPAYFYAMFENAYAHAQGHTRSQHASAMGQLFEGFANVAAGNAYAQFPAKRSAAFLSTPSKENYPFADPYLKWHMAQDAVNMAAAVLLMSSEKADALGIAPEKRVYLHGAGEAGDHFISERPRLDGSWAMETALARALAQAGKSADDMDVLDLYSCFPIAVFSSTQELGIDWRSDARALTQTGGLPFFGGPGNNYSLHGIVSSVDALRAAPTRFGLVLANGGWMTKEAVGIYSMLKPDQFTPAEPAAMAKEKVVLEEAPTTGTLETFTIVQGREGPSRAIIFARTDAGKRFIAISKDSQTLGKLGEAALPIGAPLTVSSEGEVNTFKLA